MMAKDHWDAILASAPLNATAGRVVAAGEHYDPAIKIVAPEWDAPPQFAPMPPNGPQFENFVGHTHGRLRVVGYLGGGKWCCRCACGKYVSRRTATIRRSAPEDRCSMCLRTAWLAREATAERVAERKALGVFFQPKPTGRDAA